MRGKVERQISMLSSLTPEQLVPQDHPIRHIKPIVDKALGELSATFNRMYADMGRPSIPPEHLLKSCLLIALYSIRSERQFCERLRYDLLFKWFLDLNIMDPAFDASTFSKNKQRLLESRVAREFLGAVVAEARRRELLSEDHFTVDGILLEAWASLKSFRSKDGDEAPGTGEKNPGINFHGEHRTNATHGSTTDPEARLARKGAGKEAKLCFPVISSWRTVPAWWWMWRSAGQRGLRSGKLRSACWKRCLGLAGLRWGRTRATIHGTLLPRAGR